MSVTVSPVANSQNFGTWLARTNQLTAIISANVVTTDNTVSGGMTSGNGTVNGSFGSNTLFVIDNMRGGNVTTSNTLTIISNTIFSNTSSNLVSFVSNATSSNVLISVDRVNITGNTAFANSISAPQGTFNTIIGNTSLAIGSNVNISTSSVSVGNSTVNTYFTISALSTNGSLGVYRAATLANTLSTTGAVTLSNTLAVTGNTTLSNTITLNDIRFSVDSSSTVGNTTHRPLKIWSDNVETTDLTVTGLITGTFNTDGNIIPNSNTTNDLGSAAKWFDEIYVQSITTNSITTNGVIETTDSFKLPDGSIITSSSNTTVGYGQQAVDTFSTTTYRSADYVISIKDNNANGYQITKILIVHDGGTSYATEYGTMATNTSLGIFSTDINNGNVRLLVTPTSTSTTMKISRTTLVV